MPGANISEFFLGGVAACGACLFSNPLEVVKTRMQLQGELQARGTYQRHYRNVFHAFYTIGRIDGLLALQKGLVPALWYQLFMNGFRLGSYQCFVNLGLTKNSKGEVSVVRSVAGGAIAGCTGACVASPFYMVKTHLQAQSTNVIAVGYQHTHTSFTKALAHTFTVGGVAGLWRGVTAAMVRVSIGSGVQLSTFSTCKEFVLKTEFFHPQSFAVPLFASMASGVAVVCAMTPFDVISTRLYNQGLDSRGRGIYYNGFIDCLWKIFKKEGIFGFYKGWSASWFRTAPHTVLSLFFWDEARKLYKRLKGPV